MSSSYPAFRGSFGSTEFYVVTMKAGQFIRDMTIPKNMEGWEDLSPEEKFQREVNYKRVKDHIAPYLVSDDDRFIGAFIVAIHQHEDVQFESLVDSGIKFPAIMPKSVSNQFGVLYLSGSEVLVPLDGQHRLAALKFAITGKDEKDAEIPGLHGSTELANDVCTVIFIRNDPQKSRKIFNKVNRYAKPTSKADNLITADDDYIAVLVRQEIVGPIIDTRLVNLSSNTIPKSSGLFSTLATIYEITFEYESVLIGKKPQIGLIPDSKVVALAKQNATDFWKKFLKINAYESSLLDPSEASDKRRSEIREQSLICKPIVQRALAEATFALLLDEGKSGQKLGMEQIVERINSVDWSPSESSWQGVLVNGDKIITGNSARNFAARIIAYRLGKSMEQVEIDKLSQQFEESTDGRKLPARLIEPS